MLRHRARYVHQAEHDGLRHRLRHLLETPVTDIDRIDERDPAHLCLQRLDLGQKFDAPCLAAAIRQFGFKCRQRFRPRPPQCDPARHRPTDGPAHRNIRRRAGGCVTGPADALVFHLGKLSLGEIGQFQVVKEQVDEFFAAQDKPECILAVALTRTTCFSATLAGTRKHVAFDELLVSGQHHIAGAAFATEARLVHPLDRNTHLSAFQDVLDVPVLRRFLHRALHQRLGPAKEALAVLQTLAARIQAPIDDMNGHFRIRLRLNRPASRACTTRRAAGPDARCSRVRPSARQTRRASFRYRHPFSTRTRSPEAGLRLARRFASR